MGEGVSQTSVTWDVRIVIYLGTVLSLPPHLLPQLHDTAKDTDEDVCVHAPLMCLIDDDDGVFVNILDVLEEGLGECLGDRSSQRSLQPTTPTGRILHPLQDRCTTNRTVARLH